MVQLDYQPKPPRKPPNWVLITTLIIFIGIGTALLCAGLCGWWLKGI